MLFQNNFQILIT